MSETGFFTKSWTVIKYPDKNPVSRHFSEPIGYILKADGTRIPLQYGEIKIKKTTGKYHVIPRTRPRISY
ncbi:DUF6972 family protein [Tychonema sp. BBK16]|uniref:DUF6972 family protein n=1 Tax=Tychonema sp. BBK16 TaxID=2699888 RepID=UPI0038D2F5C1